MSDETPFATRLTAAASGYSTALPEADRFDQGADGETLGSGSGRFGENLFQSLSDVARKPLEWVWEGLIPRGKVTLVTGEPGVGKSLFALQVAAMVTRGWRTPVCSAGPKKQRVEQELLDPGAPGRRRSREQPGQTAPAGPQSPTEPVTMQRDLLEDDERALAGCQLHTGDQRTQKAPIETDESRVSEPGAVLLFSADDGLADTVRPRLEAVGAEVSNVFILASDRLDEITPEQPLRVDCDSMERKATSQGSRAERVRMDCDLTKLETGLRALQDRGVDVRLVVFDPIDCMNSSDGVLDSSQMASRLVDLAARSGAAVLVVANSSSSAIGRMGLRPSAIGNRELANSARSVLMVVRDLECEQQRLVLTLKTNLCGQGPGLAFSIRDGGLEWSSRPIRLTGEEYVAQAMEKLRNPLIREECSELDRVTEWLRRRLSQGMVESIRVRGGAYQQEIAYSTLRRAFIRLGCKAIRFGIPGRWYWRLPGEEEVEPPMAARAGEPFAVGE